MLLSPNDITLNYAKECEYMQHSLPEEQLMDYAKTYLKTKSFKKKNKRWTKDIGDFTLCFYVQGSCFSKEDYYIRPGIFINSLLPTNLVYGHWYTQIRQTTPEKILSDFEKWCTEWTDKALIKKRLLEFIEWDKRNTLENRRNRLVDYETDPVPAREFFSIAPETIQHILENF